MIITQTRCGETVTARKPCRTLCEKFRGTALRCKLSLKSAATVSPMPSQGTWGRLSPRVFAEDSACTPGICSAWWLEGQFHSVQALPTAQAHARARGMHGVGDSERQERAKCRLLLWRPQVEVDGPAGKGEQAVSWRSRRRSSLKGGWGVSWVKVGVEKDAAGSGQCTGAGDSRCVGDRSRQSHVQWVARR